VFFLLIVLMCAVFECDLTVVVYLMCVVVGVLLLYLCPCDVHDVVCAEVCLFADLNCCNDYV